MYELCRAGENTYFVDCPAKIGVYVRPGGRACLIDSGGDRGAGKRALRILQEQGWELEAVINTHSHADHIGGNRYLQAQTGCRVFADGLEAAVIGQPVLEPACLYGGCPPGALRHKFLMAEASVVTPSSDPAFPKELELIPLPGHSFGMVGVRTPDDVVFLADCLTGQHTLEKYRIPYLYDVAAHLETLDRVAGMRARLFVPSHAGAGEDMSGLVRLNRENTLETAELLMRLLKSPMGFDALLKAVFQACGLAMTFEQHALVGSTVRSYLTWLLNEGRATVDFTSGIAEWQSVD